ncbi:MAG: hypothetical protein ACYDHU_11165 [Acidimicrobiales bacterium]
MRVNDGDTVGDATGAGGRSEGEEGDSWGEEVPAGPGARPHPGDIISGPTLRGGTEPLVGSDRSTALDEDESDGVVPPSPLWAMKDRRHIQWHLIPSHERHQRIRDSIGSGDEVVYVIDDGGNHVMLGRRIGAVGGECEYCLVGRVPVDRYEALRSGTVTPIQAFEGAADITVCGVAQEEGILSSNVFDVARYRDESDVPARFRPGAPYLDFESALEITVG